VRDRTIRNADRFVFARSADTRVAERLARAKPPPQWSRLMVSSIPRVRR
jgi:hypothetical protein